MWVKRERRKREREIERERVGGGEEKGEVEKKWQGEKIDRVVEVIASNGMIKNNILK